MVSSFFARRFGFHRTQNNLHSVMVIGLGRFGTALGEELINHGIEVLGVDTDPRIVQEQQHYLTDAVVADTTDAEALHQLGVEDFDRVVIGIGNGLESSLLTASNLVEMGVEHIWAKADSDAHARILQQIGVAHVVRPERDTGKRVAHLLSGRFEDFAEFDSTFGMVRMSTPPSIRRGEIDYASLLRQKRLKVVAVLSDGQWSSATEQTSLLGTEAILLAGEPRCLEEFSAENSDD